MRFALKVFLSIFLVAFSISTLVIVLLYGIERRDVDREFEERYRAVAEQVIGTLTQLEVTTDLVLENALKLLYEIENERGVPSQATLRRLVREMNLFALWVIDSNGDFLRTTGKDPETVNFFAYCEGYRKMITGESLLEKTPIVITNRITGPAKFTMIPNHNHTRILEAGVLLGFIGETLSKALRNGTDLLSIGLFTPSGTNLGFISRTGETTWGDSIPITQMDFNHPVESHDSMVLYSRVPANTDKCCECKTKHLTVDGEKYFYILRTEVTRKRLTERLSTLGWQLSMAWGLAMFLSYLLAQRISRRLVRRIEIVDAGVQNVMTSGNLALRLNLSGSDEMASLANQFDRMLESLEGQQRSLLAAQKDHILAELVSQVAHDIRSPLAALRGALGTLQDLPAEQRSLLDAASHRIEDIANDLLKKRREISAKTESVPCDLNVLLQTVLQEKRMQYRSRPDLQILETAESNALDLFVILNPTEFQRCISNLIDNAVQATENSGAVTVDVKRTDHHVEIGIKDTGRGIEPDLLKQLMTRPITSRKTEGSGLGLYHANKTIQSFGGTVELSSTVGKGTQVSIRLPLTSRPPSTS